MADFLLEIGLEEIPARMIAGAEAELGKRVTDLLTRERLLEDGGQGEDLFDAAAAGGAGGGCACGAGGRGREADRAVVEAWHSRMAHPTPAAEAFAKKAGVAVARWRR